MFRYALLDKMLSRTLLLPESRLWKTGLFREKRTILIVTSLSDGAGPHNSVLRNFQSGDCVRK